MNIKNHYLLIFALLTAIVKWSLSFYFFPESLDTKIFHDGISDAKLYYPLIKFLSELNFNYSYDPEIYNLKSVPLPFWGIFFHSLFLKFLGFYSFIILDFLCVFIILLIFFHIFKISFTKELSIILSILLFLTPYLISNSFLTNIQYFNLFGDTFYHLRVPRPMISNLYFYSFILISLKLVTEKFYDFKKFFLLGLIMALSISFYYHFFIEALFLLFILIIKFKFKIFIELKNNFKYYLVLIFTFLLLSSPFFISLYFHEPEFTTRQCIYNLDWDIKTKLLKYFLTKYLSLKGIIFISLLSFLTVIGNKFKFTNNLDKKVINIFYFFFLASLFAPIVFILISPKTCVFHHFVNLTILNAFLFLIFYFLIISKSLIKFKFNSRYNFVLILIFFVFFTFQEITKVNLKKNSESHIQYRNEFNLVTKKIESNYKIKDIGLLTFETDLIVWSIMKNIKYLDLNISIFTPKKDFMIEEDIFSVFKKLGLNEVSFDLFIKNQKSSWRYINQHITKFVYYKYSANSLFTYKNSNDFEKDEIEHIKKTHLLLQQQQMIPKFELERLKSEFKKFDGNLIFPEVILLNKTDEFLNNKNLNLDGYCNIFNGKVFVMYFKDDGKSCNNQ